MAYGRLYGDEDAGGLKAVAQPAAPDTRKGWGQGPGEQAAAARAPELAAAATEVGGPTSFAGGVGAPMPVEIVRGVRTTYTNPAPYSGGGYSPNPSQNTREFSSPLTAQQAYNRGQRSMKLAEIANLPSEAQPGAKEAVDQTFGTYQPPGTTLEAQKIAGKIAEVKAGGPAIAATAAAPGLAAAADTQVGNANLDQWKKLLPGQIGAGHEYDEGAKKWVPSADPEFLALHQKYAPIAYTNPVGAAEGFKGEYADLQNKRLVTKHAPVILADKIATMSPELKRWAFETPEGRAETVQYIKYYQSKNKKNFWNTGATPSADQFAQ